MAAAGVLQLSHGEGEESYGHEALAYAPIASYGGHEEPVDYYVRYL